MDWWFTRMSISPVIDYETINFTIISPSFHHEFHHAETPEATAALRCSEVGPDGRQCLAEFRDAGLERQDSAPRWTTSSGFPLFFFPGKITFF